MRPVQVHRFLDGPAIPSPSRHRLACLSPHRPSGGSTWALCGGLPNGILQDFHPSPVQTRSLPRYPAFRVSAWRVGVLSDLCFGGVPLHGVWRPAVPPPCGSARWQSICGGTASVYCRAGSVGDPAARDDMHALWAMCAQAASRCIWVALPWPCVCKMWALVRA